MNIQDKIVRGLAACDPAYEQESLFVRQQAAQGLLWRRTSVIMLLSGHGESQDSWFFVANKRAADVAQPGDLCWPGGHPRPFVDGFAARIFVPRVYGRGPGMAALHKRGRATSKACRYFLAAALRECWEEMRVPPCHIVFLGALPAYRMIFRPIVIHPMVGLLKPCARMGLGPEVERNVPIPLKSLFNPQNYGTYTLFLEEGGRAQHMDFPCFLTPDENGGAEVLWGATFNILKQFLELVFGFHAPESGPVRRSALLYPHVG